MRTWFYIILFIVLILIGCDGQKRVSFNINDDVIVKGNDVSFEYKDLRCEAKWNLKDSEKGLLTEDDVSVKNKIVFNKGILSELECNQDYSCEGDYCVAGRYYIKLDPEIGEIESSAEWVSLSQDTFNLKNNTLDVEIGDIKNEISKPSLTLYKWDREDYLIVELDRNNPTSTSLSNEKVKQEYTDLDVNFYYVNFVKPTITGPLINSPDRSNEIMQRNTDFQAMFQEE